MAFLRQSHRRWTIRECASLGDDRGQCQPPDAKGKEIRLLKSLKGEERIEVLLHECVHGAGWHLDEEYVRQFAEDVARVLWKQGYRRVGET